MLFFPILRLNWLFYLVRTFQGHRIIQLWNNIGPDMRPHNEVCQVHWGLFASEGTCKISWHVTWIATTLGAFICWPFDDVCMVLCRDTDDGTQRWCNNWIETLFARWTIYSININSVWFCRSVWWVLNNREDRWSLQQHLYILYQHVTMMSCRRTFRCRTSLITRWANRIPFSVSTNLPFFIQYLWNILFDAHSEWLLSFKS